MTLVVRFNTTMFDVSRERPNPINPIPGESLLLWLKAHATTPVSAPEPEDWGWYADVVWEGRAYLLGASASEDEDGEREWILQVHKQRSLTERLLGREKMTGEDACGHYFRTLIENEPGFRNVSADAEP